MQKKYFGFFLGITVFLLIILFTDLKPGNPEVTATLAVACLMAIWWVSETIPLSVTALVPLVLFPAFGVLDGKAVSEVYMNHIIFVYVGGFMMALAMERWGLHRRIALKLLMLIGVSPGRILLGFMATSAFLWITRAGITFSKVTIPGWAQLFKTPDYINDGTVAMFISIILFLVPAGKDRKQRIMNWETAQRIPWNIVLLFGGGFALALGFQSSGLAVWFGEQLLWAKNVHPYLILLAVVALMSFLTELTSNVASTQMLLPIFASLALSSGNNPMLFMIPATPPNAIIFGTNRIRIATMVRTGFILNMLGILVVVIVTWLLGDAIWDIVPGAVPVWGK